MKKTIILFLVLSLVVCLIPAFSVVSSAKSVNSFTHHVAINEKIRVYFTDNEIFIPTDSGEFKVYLNRYANWGFSYSDDIHNILPDFMFAEGIKPVSVDFGMDIDVSWDSGFSAETNLNLNPSFKFVSNGSNFRVNSQYPGGYEMAPYFVNYIQDGREYGSNWERNLRNAPYTFQFKYSTNTDVPSYDGGFGAWIAYFQYGNVAGDDISPNGYGLEFTIQDFYITFNYIDDRDQVFQDNIQHNPGLGQSGMSWDDYFKNNPLPSFNVDLSGFAPIFSLAAAAVSDLTDITAPFRVSYDISIAGVRFDPIDIYLKIVTAVALLFTLIDIIRGVRRLT